MIMLSLDHEKWNPESTGGDPKSTDRGSGILWSESDSVLDSFTQRQLRINKVYLQIFLF